MNGSVKPRPKVLLNDAVDQQTETYAKLLNTKRFKPTEGMTQGYLESQRIFARTATIVLAFSGALNLELQSCSVSTDDILLKLNKAMETYIRPWKAKDLVDEVGVIEMLQANSRTRDKKYSHCYDGYVSKSLVWSVASTVRTFFVANFYGIETSAIGSVTDFVLLAKSVVVKDFNIFQFNYGKYTIASSRPRFNRRIPQRDRDSGGTHGAIDAFIRAAGINRSTQSAPDDRNTRPRAIQDVVDKMHQTQDSLSAFLPCGKFKDRYVALNIASTNTPAGAESDERPLESVLGPLRGLLNTTVLSMPFNHDSEYSKSETFLNVPRNMRGISIYYEGRDNNSGVTDKSYTEDVASGALGLAFLMQKGEMFGFVGNGMSLAASIDWGTGIVERMGIHVDAMVFVSIIKDGGDGSRIDRVSPAGDPLLEDVLTNELLGCSLHISIGIPDIPDGEPANLCFFAAFALPQVALAASNMMESIDTFFDKVLGYALSASDVLDHMTYEEYEAMCISEGVYRIPLRVLFNHSPVVAYEDPAVYTDGSVKTDPKDTITTSAYLGEGASLCDTAIRNITNNFAARLSSIESLA